MKRDMELVRQILLAIEAQHDGTFACRLESDSLKIDGFDPVAIGYHVRMLVQEGFVTANDFTHRSSLHPNYLVSAMTWAGHDFLDASRNPTVWDRAKQTIGDMSSVSFEVLKNVLTSVGTKMILGHVDQ